MKIMFVGLGLIGGSMALALRGYPEMEPSCITRNPAVRGEALRQRAVFSAWPDADSAPLEEQDVVVLCLPPQACLEFVQRHAQRLKADALLTDVCGVKQPLFTAVQAVKDRRFHYLGGHPMAGKERGGYANASADLFRGAHYILTPEPGLAQEYISLLTCLAHFMGFADIIMSDPKAHDERIAYTSQLMHIMALALCDQDFLFDSYGFEGNSFRGATRVAALDPQLWCELFEANSEVLAEQIDEVAKRLTVYADLVRGGDHDALLRQLTLSSDRKKAFDELRGIVKPNTSL